MVLPHTPAQLRSIGNNPSPETCIGLKLETNSHLLKGRPLSTLLITAVKRTFCRTHVLTSARPLDIVQCTCVPPPHITPAFLSLVVLPKAHEPNAIQTRLLGMCRCGQFLVRGMATLGLLTEHEASMSCHAMPCHIMDPARSCEISLASAGRHPAPSFFGQLRMPRSWLGPDDSIQKSRPLPNEASA